MIEAGMAEDIRNLYWFTDTKTQEIQDMTGIHRVKLYEVAGPLVLPCVFCNTEITYTSRTDYHHKFHKADGSRLAVCYQCEHSFRGVRRDLDNHNNRPMDGAFIDEIREKMKEKHAKEEERQKAAEESRRRRNEERAEMERREAAEREARREKMKADSVPVTLYIQYDEGGSYTIFHDWKNVPDGDVESFLHLMYTEHLRNLPYSEYLKSHHWGAVKARIKRRKTCQLCNSKEGLHVHHRTYERRGEELDEDLVLLCAECHRKFHNKDGGS